ncbi:peroxiredoxin family protein, partial [Actinotalea sp.]|uniref:peroxiredoxin family protein n=1 Tax=Actinotalea sp. TaxID=1872145 RepID=UPI0035668CFC
MSGPSSTGNRAAGVAAARGAELARRTRKSRLVQAILWVGILALIAAVVAVGLVTSRPDSSSEARQAPDFTLPTTAGTSVSLSQLRGRPVLLYFNEGAGCDACTMQLAAIERDQEAFDALDLQVLPIVMNSLAQIQPDLDRFQVTTPVLIDDGTVSAAYDTLGKGMHAGLPGHSFVL